MKNFKRSIALFIVLVMTSVLVPCMTVNAEKLYKDEVSAVFDADKPTLDGLRYSMSGKVSVAERDGQNVWELNGGNVLFDILPNLYMSNGDSWRKAPRYHTFDVEIKYFDEGYNGFFFQYDSYNGVKSVFVRTLGTGEWRTARIRLYDAQFANQDSNNDFMIITADQKLMPYARGNMSPWPVYIKSINVRAIDSRSGFEINAETGKPGNVFYDDESVCFDVNFKNVDGEIYKAVTAKYSVYKYESDDMYACWSNGAEAEAYSTQTPIATQTKSLDMSENGATDRVVFEDLPFGVYVLKIDMDSVYGDGISQHMSYITDFSRSLRGETNYQFGVNTHYDDYYESGLNKGELLYTKEQLKAQVDLAKNAGFGIIRSGARWSDIQGKDKNFHMPENFTYVYRYVAEQGLDCLINLTAGNSLGLGELRTNYHTLGLTKEGRDAFAAYAKYVAENLGDYTKYFSMPNEYDMCGSAEIGKSGDKYDADSELSYYNLCKAGYEAIKGVNPDYWVNIGEIAEDPAWQFGIPREEYAGLWTWDTRLYEKGALKYSDSISYHRYVGYQNEGPEHYSVLNFIKYGIMQKNKYEKQDGLSGKQFWVNEIGWPARATATWPGNPYWYEAADRRTTFEPQAWYYARAFAMYAGNPDIGRFIFYEFQDDREDPFAFEENYGIIHSYNYRTPFAAKYAYIASAAFNNIVGEGVKSESLGYQIDYDHEHPATCKELIYKVTNKKGEETYCVWLPESAVPTVENVEIKTGKKYAVVYDIYGNITDIADGGTVRVKPRGDMQYVKGVDMLSKGDLKLLQNDKRPESVWCMQDGSELKLSYIPSDNAKNVTLVMATYNSGVLCEINTVEKECDGDRIEETYNVSDFENVDELRFFAFDGITNIKPLASGIKLSNFGEDKSISVKKDGNTITVVGSAAELNDGDLVYITVFSNDVRNKKIDDESFAEQCIYQDCTTADGTGKYEITFNVSEDITGAGIVITSGNYSTQTTVY